MLVWVQMELVLHGSTYCGNPTNTLADTVSQIISFNHHISWSIICSGNTGVLHLLWEFSMLFEAKQRVWEMRERNTKVLPQTNWNINLVCNHNGQPFTKSISICILFSFSNIISRKNPKEPHHINISDGLREEHLDASTWLSENLAFFEPLSAMMSFTSLLNEMKQQMYPIYTCCRPSTGPPLKIQ